MNDINRLMSFYSPGIVYFDLVPPLQYAADETLAERMKKMTVIHRGPKTWRQGNRPEWSTIPSAGFFRLAAEGDIHDRHYHELNELYLISRGKAKILNGGQQYYVQESDIVCILAGDDHDILEVYGDEDLQLFYLYEPGRVDARLGHLHYDPKNAEPHPVPRKPVPEDFPPPRV